MRQNAWSVIEESSYRTRLSVTLLWDTELISYKESCIFEFPMAVNSKVPVFRDADSLSHFTGTCCIILYLFTPLSRVLIEKLTGSQLVKKFSAFYGTRRFITVFTSARHLSLSWASPIQSMPPHPTSWRSILLLSCHLRLGLPRVLFTPCFPTHVGS